MLAPRDRAAFRFPSLSGFVKAAFTRAPGGADGEAVGGSCRVILRSSLYNARIRSSMHSVLHCCPCQQLPNVHPMESVEVWEIVYRSDPAARDSLPSAPSEAHCSPWRTLASSRRKGLI